MANYYKEINKMIEKIIHNIIVLDKRGFKLGLKGEVLSFLDIYIIKIIGQNSMMSIYNLVNKTGVDRGIIASVVNKMVAGGYFKKEKSKDDKRVYMVMLTEEGKKVYDKIIDNQNNLLEFILSDITLNEEKALLKFLSKVNQKTI
ncbi:DNA-binding transcriptional regulator, MarR family [Caminicella sporogenes DSM 14501]|uniref:HTH-type transcriptional regulator SarZ n=1 Tax=Caminicella sporogenes DSM 14501 TaxID=1121266 RepID=A0A1M6Q795_9FIRM|nr:winged helix DNA-binding protein [Caminicella sporogenes]RKD23598.1 hypothetical protein BET04_04155 [Caminicella sporogenes]WIF93941.1 winged helix DNA-binding protein [Caminicella sporogenes]SHK15963.1 DNA-binding transcriptional regulator, MarR family [Caminicella sporogenes DSM 14501]